MRFPLRDVPLLLGVLSLSMGCAEVLGFDDSRELEPKGGGGGAGANTGASGGGGTDQPGGSGEGGGGGVIDPYVQAVLEDEPILYLRLEDERSPLKNEITGGQDATCSGGLVYGQPARVGNGLEFPGVGTEVVVEDDANELDFLDTSTFTIELWAWANENDRFQHLVAKRVQVGSNEHYGFSLSIEGDSHMLSFTRADHADTDDPIRNAKWPMETGRFIHIVATFDGTTQRLYIDGEPAPAPDGVVVGSGVTLPDLEEPLRIGSGDGFGYFNGTLDEIAIYKEALSGTRIRAHYEAASP
ncbi:MAG: LamG domain-containing protein [Polyangiaceae bacterium]|nr:LamG domain-containing protein [Polyangiaceae bacterium]